MKMPVAFHRDNAISDDKVDGHPTTLSVVTAESWPTPIPIPSGEERTQGLGVFRRTMISKCQDGQASRFDCELRSRLPASMDGLVFLQSLLKPSEHLLFCNSVPVRASRTRPIA